MNNEKASSIALSSVAMPVLAVCAASAIFYYASAILIPMTIAVATAYTLTPVVAFLRKIKVPHFLAVLLVMALLLAIGVVLTAIVISQVADLARDLPQYQQTALDFFNKAKDWVSSYLNQFPGIFPEIKDFKLDTSYFSGAGKIFFKGIGSMTSLAFSGFLLFFLTYFILSDYEMFVE